MSTENTKVSMDQLVVKELYYRYRDFITPVGVICICLFTVWVVILPQIQNWFGMQQEVATDVQQIQILKQNLNAITQMNDTTLNSLLTISSSALPTTKDFSAMVNALNTAALAAGTQIGDYTFQIGNVAGVIPNTPTGVGPTSLQLSVTIPGTIQTMKEFVRNLKKSLPLSDVISVSQNTDSTITVIVVFYYAPLPKITFHDTLPLTIIAGKDEVFLESLKSVQ